MTNENIEELLAEISRLTANKIQEVEEIRVKLLGKKGDITKLFEEFRNVLPEQKREFGKKLNILKTKAAEKIEELRAKVEESLENKESGIDFTRPGDKFELGTRHPIQRGDYLHLQQIWLLSCGGAGDRGRLARLWSAQFPSGAPCKRYAGYLLYLSGREPYPAKDTYKFCPGKNNGEEQTPYKSNLPGQGIQK